MATEIERKFLTRSDAWRAYATGVPYRQGYLSSAKERVVRVRTVSNKGFLTIKGITTGATRAEYEYEIPVTEANNMLDTLCEKPLIEKLRHTFSHDGFTWEVDEFLGANQGLIVAEIELESEDQSFTRPDWLGDEVTGDPKYYNSSLITRPFSIWK